MDIRNRSFLIHILPQIAFYCKYVISLLLTGFDSVNIITIENYTLI